jgi:hypothetical protein
MSTPLYVDEPDPAVTAWLNDLRGRQLRGETPPIRWSYAKEPYCIHSRETQPAGACLICKDGPERKAWVDYWRSLGAPIDEKDTP